MPILSHKENINTSSSPSEIIPASGVDNILSSHLLLPDNFGDIYLGERFSAYISVVNGFPQVPFFNVTMSVKLQETSSVIDLFDVRASNLSTMDTNAALTDQDGSSTNMPSSNYSGSTPGLSPLASRAKLSCGESCEVLVQHTLNTLGNYTLRVTVNYQLQPGGEVKNLRKFYRFQVVVPLTVASTFKEINNIPMVQCLVTNVTKAPIFIDEVSHLFVRF